MLVVYGHYGSRNHGNEAIVRGVLEIFANNPLLLYSFFPEADAEYGLDQLCEIRPFLKQVRRFTPAHIYQAIARRLCRDENALRWYQLQGFFSQVSRERTYMLTAGDQYCEDHLVRDFYSYVNQGIVKRGAKTVMLPCTIRASDVKDRKLIEDLNRYSLIFARESITYQALVNVGIEHVRLVPDPAFIMQTRALKIDDGLLARHVVGLTVGMMAQGQERHTTNLIERSRELIGYILDKTDWAIALIPHVNVSASLTDEIPLKELYEEYRKSERVYKIPEMAAPELKYVISKCRFMVTLRTHASIAAYSTGVPTLVIGYSQKSEGIARDLFGATENFVVKADALKENMALVRVFEWLVVNEDKVRQQLRSTMPTYAARVRDLYSEIVHMTGAAHV